MKTDIFMLFAASALALFSCSKEKSLAPEQAGQMRFAVTVEGDTKASMTSADLNQFYLKVTGPNNAFSYFESITKDAQGNWTASRPILWKDEKSSITYAAASYGALGPDYLNVPVTDALFSGGSNMGLLTDQSTQAKLNAADLLTMASTNLTFAASNKGIVPITLKHGLAKVNFQLTLAAEYKDNGIGLEENPISGVILHGVRTSFNFKPLTGEVSIGASKGAVVPFASKYDNTAALATFEAILVPETLAAGALSLYITVNGKDFQWTNSTPLTFEQGGEYEIPVSVDYVAAPVTPDPGDTVLDGAINGKFSVSATKQVYFSKGNLRYASSKWSFFDNQYDYYSSYSADAWDHFGWSTSATTYGMNTSTDNLDYSGDFVDWGSNSDLQTALGTGWFTLTSDEWEFLFKTRSASTVGGTDNGRYAKAKVNDVNGLILFPDTYTHPDGVTAPTNVNTTNASFDSNTYTVADWTKMESAGCVFLPAARSRNGSTVNNPGESGYYWSATPESEVGALNVFIGPTFMTPVSKNSRKIGFSVRLVKEVDAPAPASGTDFATITADYEAKDGETLTGTLASNVKISIADGATVTLKDVTINGVSDPSYGWAGITCAGDATITLEGTNTVKGFQRDYPGIYVPEGKTLTIEGEGSLNASGNGYSTGIGGGYYMNCGDIVINGGNITATGANYNAGIGGGDGGNCGAITITGGTVTATGGGYAAGIGGGNEANCGNITISGGTVTATGGQFAAGIGGGKRGFSGGGQCGNITISGGTINATGGENAAGIGGGKGRNDSSKSSCGTITITSGVTSVTATKGSSAENSIGAGSFGTCGAVTIEDPSKVTQN